MNFVDFLRINSLIIQYQNILLKMDMDRKQEDICEHNAYLPNFNLLMKGN